MEINLHNILEEVIVMTMYNKITKAGYGAMVAIVNITRHPLRTASDIIKIVKQEKQQKEEKKN